jgi:hypothetical protein
VRSRATLRSVLPDISWSLCHRRKRLRGCRDRHDASHWGGGRVLRRLVRCCARRRRPRSCRLRSGITLVPETRDLGMGCIVHCSWSARRTHVRAQIYCYFRQCFMQPRALAHHTSALSAVLQRRTCAHTGGVQPRRGAARAPPPPPRRRRGARRGRRGAARARRGPLARRGSRPPPPPAGTDAVRAPRFCACATWPYFSIKRTHSS